MTSWKNALQNGISYALGDDKVCSSDDVDDDDNNNNNTSCYGTDGSSRS